MLMLIVGVLIIYAFMGKGSPDQMGLLPDGDKPAFDSMPSPVSPSAPVKISLKPILKTSQFWILVCCNLLAVMTVMMTFNCQIAYAINRGINDLDAAAALGVIGMTGSCGKLFFGWFCDHVRDAKYAAATGFMIMAIGIILLYRAETIAMLYVFAAIYGFGYGSMAPVMPYMISDRFEKQAFGSAYGLLVSFATGVGGSIGPVMGGYIFDRTGSYGPGWLLCIVILLIVAALILTLKSKIPGVKPERH
jgi:MFS family permease